MNKPTNVTQKLLRYLQSGRDITTAQAKARFGITNVAARISEIRQAGYAVYMNTKTTAQGYTIRAYRLGSPTRKMVALAHFIQSNPDFFGSARLADALVEEQMASARV